MKHFSISIALVISFTMLVVWNAAAQTNDFKEDKNIKIKLTDNADLPFEFNYGRRLAIWLNLKMPKSETLKKNLVSSLAEKQILDKVVFLYFSPKKLPKSVQVSFGTKVPLDIAQSVIKAIEASDIKFKVKLNRRTGKYDYSFQVVYIGGLEEQPGEPITQDRINSLLNPRLSLDQFHRMIDENMVAKKNAEKNVVVATSPGMNFMSVATAKGQEMDRIKAECNKDKDGNMADIECIKKQESICVEFNDLRGTNANSPGTVIGGLHQVSTDRMHLWCLLNTANEYEKSGSIDDAKRLYVKIVEEYEEYSKRNIERGYQVKNYTSVMKDVEKAKTALQRLK